MRINPIVLIGGTLWIGLLAGCNSQDAHNLEHDTSTLAKDTTVALGSATLVTKVNTVLSLRKGVDMSGLHVSATDDGTVTLGGHVRNEEERKRVIDTVDGIRGVDKIVSKDLHVQP